MNNFWVLCALVWYCAAYLEVVQSRPREEGSGSISMVPWLQSVAAEAQPWLSVCLWWAGGWERAGSWRTGRSLTQACPLAHSPLLDSQDVSDFKALVAPTFFHPQAFHPREVLCTGWLAGSSFWLPHDLSFVSISHPSIFGITTQPPKLCSLGAHLALVQLCGQPEWPLKYYSLA